MSGRALVPSGDGSEYDPERLRATFMRAFDPMVLTPSPQGYRIAGKIKAPGIRVVPGGLSPSNYGCGGPMVSFLSTANSTDAALILPIRGRIRPKSIYRGLRGALLSA